MSSPLLIAMEVAKGALFVSVALVIVPVVLFGHLAAVLTGYLAFLA